MTELNEHHKAALHNYMRFTRYLRTQRLRAVDLCFEHVETSRLHDETYTREEIISILKELADVVRADMESELINMAHVNALLLHKIFWQAQQWHLKLYADVDDLENRELLEKIKMFEDETPKQSESGNQRTTSPVKCRLEPLNPESGVKLLQNEIERLQNDNTRLREQLKMLESKATGLIGDQSKLSAELLKAKDAFANQAELDDQYSKEISELQHQLSTAQHALTNLEVSNSRQQDLEGSFAQVQHQLLHVKEQLENSEKELDMKVCQTPAYQNLKKLLLQKNDIIKTLRQKLDQYEPSSIDADDES